MTAQTGGRAGALFRELSAQRLLFRGGLGYLVGEAASKGITFAVLIAVARFMAPEAFAWVNLYIVFANIAALLVGLGVQNAIVRFYFREEPFAGVLGTSAAMVGVSGVVFIVAAAALGQPLGLLLRVPAPVILAAAFGGLAIALRASLVASLRARRQARQYALVQTLEATLGAIAILGLAALGSLTYEAAILSLLGATSVIAVVALGLWANDPGLRVQRRLVIPLLAFSLPMVLHGLATYGLGAYGQIVVNLLLGPVDAGRFAYAYRFGMAMLIVATAFSAAWLPAFLESMRTESGRLGLARRALLYWASMVAVAVAFMIVLPWIAVVLGGPEYAAGARLVPLVVYAYVWHVAYTMVLGFHLEAGRTPLLALGTVVALAIGVALTLFLITTVGLVGAAVGAIGAYASLFAVQLAMTQLSERGRVLEIDYRPIAATALAVGLIPAALSLLGYPG